MPSFAAHSFWHPYIQIRMILFTFQISPFDWRRFGRNRESFRAAVVFRGWPFTSIKNILFLLPPLLLLKLLLLALLRENSSSPHYYYELHIPQVQLPLQFQLFHISITISKISSSLRDLTLMYCNLKYTCTDTLRQFVSMTAFIVWGGSVFLNPPLSHTSIHAFSIIYNALNLLYKQNVIL